jgi:hypothetical protein
MSWWCEHGETELLTHNSWGAERELEGARDQIYFSIHVTPHDPLPPMHPYLLVFHYLPRKLSYYESMKGLTIL